MREYKCFECAKPADYLLTPSHEERALRGWNGANVALCAACAGRAVWKAVAAQKVPR